MAFDLSQLPVMPQDGEDRMAKSALRHYTATPSWANRGHCALRKWGSQRDSLRLRSRPGIADHQGHLRYPIPGSPKEDCGPGESASQRRGEEVGSPVKENLCEVPRFNSHGAERGTPTHGEHGVER